MQKPSSANWPQRFAVRLAVTDAAMVCLAVFSAYVWRFGFRLDDTIDIISAGSYVLLSIVVALVWWGFLTIWNSREQRILGTGSEEYKRVLTASAWLFGLIAVVSYLIKYDVSRGYVGIAFPVGTFLLLLSRYLWRRVIVREREKGGLSYRVMLLGAPASVLHLHQSLSRLPQAGYRPVAAYLPGFSKSSPNGDELPLPVAGTSLNVDSILEAIGRYELDAVAISSGVPLSPRAIRRLGWALAERQIRLIMAPALTDVAGPRIHTQPIAGLPLIHVSTPRLNGASAFVKRSMDLLLSSAAIVALSPVLIATAIAVRAESKGPVFFNQERVGRNSERFKMHKFRSMVVDAEEQLKKLTNDDDGSGNDVLFKLKDDPRITKVGKFIRKYSIDELPQLFNVLKGEMSLVGPRPPLPREVEQYEDHVYRRLLVLPGITGLWQVSGRSDLSWDDTVRLDLYYVENWSVMQDISILFRTFKAVFSQSGAY